MRYSGLRASLGVDAELGFFPPFEVDHIEKVYYEVTFSVHFRR
jgi:hypothetical protein